MRWLPLIAFLSLAAAAVVACSDDSPGAEVFTGRKRPISDPGPPPTDDYGDPGTPIPPVTDASRGVCGVAAAAVPGTVLTSRDAKGTGVCATVTLGQVIDAARAIDPSVPQVSEPFDPNAGIGGEAPRVLAYATPEGGFALVFISGSGDCPSGCINHQYWYFETNPSSAACTLTPAGTYATTYNGAGNCYDVSGTPRWGQPKPQGGRCNADGGGVVGTYSACGSGGYTPCGGNLGVFDGVIGFSVAQSPGDPSKAIITLDGTKNSAVDGVPFEGRIDGTVVSGERTTPGSACGAQTNLTFKYDLASPPGFAGYVELSELKCDDGGVNACKGGFTISLFAE